MKINPWLAIAGLACWIVAFAVFTFGFYAGSGGRLPYWAAIPFALAIGVGCCLPVIVGAMMLKHAGVFREIDRLM